MKVKKFYEPLYKAPIYYIFNCSQKEAKRLFKKELGEVSEYRWGVGHTFAYRNDNNIVYGIWAENTKNLETLVHEIVHLAGFIFHDRNIQFDYSNDEPFTYLTEYLFKTLWKDIKKK